MIPRVLIALITVGMLAANIWFYFGRSTIHLLLVASFLICFLCWLFGGE